MAELTISQLIKIILGVLVAVVVIGGLYLVFKNYVLDFFQGIAGNETAQIILGVMG